jgi:hypothetical protein
MKVLLWFYVEGKKGRRKHRSHPSICERLQNVNVQTFHAYRYKRQPAKYFALCPTSITSLFSVSLSIKLSILKHIVQAVYNLNTGSWYTSTHGADFCRVSPWNATETQSDAFECGWPWKRSAVTNTSNIQYFRPATRLFPCVALPTAFLRSPTDRKIMLLWSWL